MSLKLILYQLPELFIGLEHPQLDWNVLIRTSPIGFEAMVTQRSKTRYACQDHG